MIDHNATFIESCVRMFNGMDWLGLFDKPTLDRVDQRIRVDLAIIANNPNLTLVKFDIDRDENEGNDPCIDIEYNIRSLDGELYAVVGDERPRGQVEYEIMRVDGKTDAACTMRGEHLRTITQVINRIDP